MRIFSYLCTTKPNKNMANDTPKKRGRPRKNPNDTTGKVGRPKKNPYEGGGWGGARPNTGGAREGAGRKHTSKITGPATIAFTVPYAVKERFQKLQASGFDIREKMVEDINRYAKIRLGNDNVEDDWTPPKKKA